MASASGSWQGGDSPTDALAGMMSGGSHGGNPANTMLGALENIIGGRPGSGQPLPKTQGMIPNAGGMESSPVMSLVEPVANQVAERAHISPAMATIAAAIAMHYLLASHPSSGRKSSLNFGSLMQELQSDEVHRSTMQTSGMVIDAKQATGLNDQQAQSGLDAAFQALASHL